MQTKPLILALLAGLAVSGAAQATLMDRGGGLIYDTDLNVTWLQDANYGAGSIYDNGPTSAENFKIDGRMTWANATAWAADLSYYDSVRNVTYTDWRLPTTTDLGAAGCQTTNNGTDCGYNVDPASSEMAHLYFTELLNLSWKTTTGSDSGALAGGIPGTTLDNTGPFIDFKSYYYWSGTEYVTSSSSSSAWNFRTQYGTQQISTKGNYFYALAVRDGDVAAIPEPGSFALVLTGLGLIGWRARRRG